MGRAIAPLVLFAALALGQQAAAAPVQYIRDVVYVPLRSGPSNQHRILQNIASGAALTVLEKDAGSDFVRARTQAGAEGWLEAQYLVDQPIARDRLAALSGELERVRSQNGELHKQVQALRGARDESAQQARQLSRSGEQLAAELAEIKRVSANAVQLQQRYQALDSEMTALRERSAALLVENGELREGRNQRAFLHGAFAVAIGCVLVLVTPRLWPRRRRSEWA